MHHHSSTLDDPGVFIDRIINSRNKAIQGLNFSKLALTNSDFRYATSGLRFGQKIIFLLALSFVASFVGFSSVIAAFLATYWFTLPAIQKYTIAPSIVMIMMLGAFIAFSVRGGALLGLGSASCVGIVSIAVAKHGAIIVPFTGAGIFGIMGWVGTTAAIFAVSLAIAEIPGAISVTTVWVLSIIASQQIVEIIAKPILAFLNGSDGTGIWFLAVLGEILIGSTGGYIGWQAVAGNEKLIRIRELAISIFVLLGTRFRESDLTNSDFSYASLKGADFRDAILKNVCWFQAKHLDLAHFGNYYLKFPQIQQLVISKYAQGADFSKFQELGGINLQGADLTGSSFVGVNLGDANLQDAILVDVDFTGANLARANLRGANLSRAKLVRTQLSQADLTGACLTGAYIENWTISCETNLESVECRYIFMHLPTNKNPNPRRKPDDWKVDFNEGDFADFIAPLVKTLDLYHNHQVDPRLVSIAYNSLINKHPDAELDLVKIECRGKNNDKLRLQATTAKHSDLSVLSSDYFSNYEQLKAMTPEALHILLCQKDKKIKHLSDWIETIISRSNVHTQDFIVKKGIFYSPANQVESTEGKSSQDNICD